MPDRVNAESLVIPLTTKRNGAVVIKAVEYAAQYKVTINGTECSITTADASSDEGINVNVTKILKDLKAKIQSKGLPVSVTTLDISLELASTNDAEFTLSGSGTGSE